MSLLLPMIPADAVVPDRRRNMVASVLLTAVLATMVGAAGVWVGRALADREISDTLAFLPRKPWKIGLLGISSWFLAVLAHELGHLAAGMLQGFRFQLLVVGPLRISRDAVTDRVSIGMNRQFELAGGVAASMPRSDEHVVSRFRRVVLAGPLASLALSCCSLLLWRYAGVATWAAFALMTGGLSGVLGVLTLIPMPNGSFVTDGRRYVELRGEDAVARRSAAMLAITTRMFRGSAPADEPAECIAPLLEPADGSSTEARARITAYVWLLDHGAVEEARTHLGRAAVLSAGLPFDFAAGVALEQAYCAARYDGDATAARATLAPHTRVLTRLPTPERLRVEAAIAAAEGEQLVARRFIAEARAAMETPRVPSGSVTWTEARLRDLESVLESSNSEPRNPNPELRD